MVKIGDISVGDFPLLLAPMEDVSDPPFRALCKENGADVVYTEFISSEGLIRDAAKSVQKLDIYEYERPIGIQIFGDKIESMRQAAEIAEKDVRNNVAKIEQEAYDLAKSKGMKIVTPSKSDNWDTPQFQYRKYGWWSSQNFMPGMYVKELYMDKVEFAGLVANGRVFRGDKGRYVTFLTLGVGNGQYIDVTIKRPFAYSDHDVIWGQGTIRHSNNSDYVECYDYQGYRLEKFSKA